jgi:putative transposase
MQRVHRRRYEIEGQARYLTFSCYKRLPLFSNDSIKRAFVESLEQSRRKHEFRLLAWVIMPEHVHLIVVPNLPVSSMPVLLRTLKQSFAQRVVNRWIELNAPILHRIQDTRGIRRFWQRGGGYDRNLYRDEELLRKIEYIHNNPVRRGLVACTTDWPWSSARWYAGVREDTLPIDSS